jgi:heme a synthase
MKYPNSVKVWLFVGLVMVYIQVIVGGITRLTESGLSITKWEVVSGILPPFSDSAWNKEFQLYKDTPQYKEINEGMSLSDFKFIYFWEYIHRFWARIMGFVFIIPFIYFLIKGYLDRSILLKLGTVILLALLAATFGWIMVASGLVHRPWVNAYKLTVHLSIAFAVFASLLWTYLSTSSKYYLSIEKRSISKLLPVFGILLMVQILIGGILSGMKAAVVHPTWPDISGAYWPAIIFDIDNWTLENFIQYDTNEFMPTLIHFIHRNIAYALFGIGLLFSYRLVRLGNGNVILIRLGYVLGLFLILQVTLGILTLLNSTQHIPVLYGVLHQAFALAVLSCYVISIFIYRNAKSN